MNSFPVRQSTRSAWIERKFFRKVALRVTEPDLGRFSYKIERSVERVLSPKAGFRAMQLARAVATQDRVNDSAMLVAASAIESIIEGNDTVPLLANERALRSLLKAAQPAARFEQDQARIAHLNDVFFGAAGGSFVGSLVDYTNPQNLRLSHVLQNRFGHDALLCFLYAYVALRIGIKAEPVITANRVMVGVSERREDSRTVFGLIDVFDGGRLMTATNVEQIPNRLSSGNANALVPVGTAVDTTAWFRCLVTPLLERYSAENDLFRMAQIQELQRVLSPEDPDLMFGLGKLYFRLGRNAAAQSLMETYVASEAAQFDPEKQFHALSFLARL